MTIVLPLPVAILAHQRGKAPHSFALVRIVPMFEQASRDARCAGPICLTPGFHSRPYLVHQTQFDKLARIIETLGAGRCHDVSGRTASFDLREDHVLPVVTPVLRRFRKGSVENQVARAESVFTFGHYTVSKQA